MKRAALLAMSLLLMTVVVGAQDIPAITGSIAIIGSDHNVYIIDENGAERALTNDGDTSRRYQFPTWSTDGRLSFFCCDINFASAMFVEVYVATPDMTAAKLLYRATDEAYTYSYWSPANCSEGPACRDLAVLLARRASPFKVELIRQNGTSTTSRSIGSGSPFYFSWNQDGERMLWHRDNEKMTIFSSGDDTEVSVTDQTPNGFQAPAFSPVDDRAAVVVAESGGLTNALVILDGDEQVTLLEGIPAAIRSYANVMAFTWSPDGRYLAYRAINRFGASSLFVVDVDKGDLVATTGEVNVIAFFWSPDSSKLMYMTPTVASGDAFARPRLVSSQPIDNFYAWSLLNIETGASSAVTTFSPSASMLYVLAYFDQFAQSHRFWSPDSRYFLYSGLTDGGVTSVNILDTTDSATVPFTIADGELGVWSYQ